MNMHEFAEFRVILYMTPYQFLIEGNAYLCVYYAYYNII